MQTLLKNGGRFPLPDKPELPTEPGTDVLSKAAGTNSGQLPDNENGSAAPDTATGNTANVPENGDTSAKNRNIKASDTLAGAPAAADIYPPAIPAAAGQTPPSAPTKDTGGKPPHGDDSPETPYETRYFTVSLDESGTVLSADVKSIAAIDKETAVSLAGELFASDKTKGFALGYRYGARTENGYAYTGGTVLAVGLAGGMSGETTTSSPSFSTIGTGSTLRITEGTYLTVEGVFTVRVPVTMNALVAVLGKTGAGISAASSSDLAFDSDGVYRY